MEARGNRQGDFTNWREEARRLERVYKGVAGLASHSELGNALFDLYIADAANFLE